MSRNKTNFTVNPETNRTIQIGGRSWLKLVKRGVIDRGDYLPPNCAYRLKEEEYENDQDKIEAIEAERERIIKNKEAPIGQKPVIYKKNQIVYQSTSKTTAADSARLTSDAALDVIDQIQNGDIDIPTDMDRDDARDYLQRLIFNQMLSKKKKFKNPKLEPKNVASGPTRAKQSSLHNVRLPLTKSKPQISTGAQHNSDHPQYRHGTASTSATRRRSGLKKPVNNRKITRMRPKLDPREEQVYFIENSDDYIDAKVIPEVPDSLESDSNGLGLALQADGASTSATRSLYINSEDQDLQDEYEYEYVDVEVDDSDSLESDSNGLGLALQADGASTSATRSPYASQEDGAHEYASQYEYES